MRYGLLAFTLVVLPAISVSAADGVTDWPSWRGPERNGISTETGLLKEWPKDGPKLLWKVDGLGRGYSSVSIVDGRIFTLGKQRRGAELTALNLADGEELWSTPVGPGNPNCTPTVDGELVYGLGRQGELVCCNTKTGDIVWSKSFKDDFGGKMMSGWGYSESPLVDGDRLIVTPGAADAAIAALNKKTGEVIWKAKMPDDIGNRGREGAAYSSVVISNAGEIKQYVQLTGRGIISVAAKDGRNLWSYNRIANGTANIPTPIVKDDFVFCSTGYGTGAALLKIEKDGRQLAAKEVYFLNQKELQNHHGGMILIGEHIYCGHGHNQGFPLCINMKTGKEAWRPGRGPGTGSAAIVFADGHLYFRYQDGVMALIEATPEEYRLKGSFKIASNNGASWPHPVIHDGKLYLRDQGTLLCYDIKQK